MTSRRVIAIGTLVVAALGAGTVSSSGGNDRHPHRDRDRVDARIAQAPAELRNAYGVFRRSARLGEQPPHASAGDVGRVVRGDGETSVYLLSKPDHSLCVIALVRAEGVGGTACGPANLADTRPPAMVLARGDAPAMVFGAAPDGVRVVTVRGSDDATVTAHVDNNLYSLVARAPVAGITLGWADGRRTALF